MRPKSQQVCLFLASQIRPRWRLQVLASRPGAGIGTGIHVQGGGCANNVRRFTNSCYTTNSSAPSGVIHTFDLTTSVSSYDSSSSNSNGPAAPRACYQGLVTDKFSVGDAPNGGYLSCMAIAASKKFASEVSKQRPSQPFQAQPHVLSLTCYFNSKTSENAPAELTV